METGWYYTQDGESVKAASGDEILSRIRQARSERHLVWKEGMPGWADASTLPEFSPAFRAKDLPATPQHISKAGGLAQKAKRELIEYAAICAYLTICFAALLFYKATILGSVGIEFTHAGLAVVKALILGKFVLILESLKIGGDSRHNRVVLVNIISKALLFTVLLFVLNLIEEMIVGYFRGKEVGDILKEMPGGTLQQAFALAVLMFLILIPFFAYREIEVGLGEGALSRLLLARRPSENRE